MKREELMPLGKLRELLNRYPDETRIFFGCPDEANPLEFVEVEEQGDKVIQVKFRLNVYKGRD